MSSLGCDFFIAGCHKWLFGPRGTGLVCARPEAWSITKPVFVSFDPLWRPEALDKMPAAASMSPGGFHAYEHRWALSAAFEFHRQIGKAKVAARVRELNTRYKEGLAKLRRVRLKTPMSSELSAGIVCFEIDGLPAKDAVARLAVKKIIASEAPPFYPGRYVRVAPALLTLEADVDRTIEAVASL